MLNVRMATREDAETVCKFAEELFSELGHTLPLDGKQSGLYCQAILESGEYVVFLSLGPHGRANGIITLSEGISIYAGGKFGVIREFYVLPEERSTGVGKALLEKAKEFGRGKGWKRIEVTPPGKVKWPRTYNFYMQSGFKEIGPGLKLEDLNEP